MATKRPSTTQDTGTTQYTGTTAAEASVRTGSPTALAVATVRTVELETARTVPSTTCSVTAMFRPTRSEASVRSSGCFAS